MNEQADVIGTGDRIPNFSLKDQQGKNFEFYTKVSGGSIVLVFIDCDDQRNASLLRGLNERLPDFEAQNAHVYVVCDDSVDAHAALSREFGLTFPLLADPGKQLIDWVVAAAQRSVPLVFVLDPNQRLISFKHGTDKADEGELAAFADYALAEVTKIAPRGKPRVFTEMAPALIIPNVFSRDFCRRLIDLWETGGHTEGAINKGISEGSAAAVDYGVKRRKDHFIEDWKLDNEIANTLGPRVGHEVEKVYHYQDWTFEQFRVGCYEDTDAGFFNTHRDNANEANQDRRYAVTLNLNAEDYEGGDLRFPEYGEDYYRPPTGGAVVFSCSLLHEVVPVTKGRRFVFLTFLRDYKTQQA